MQRKRRILGDFMKVSEIKMDFASRLFSDRVYSEQTAVSSCLIVVHHLIGRMLTRWMQIYCNHTPQSIRSKNLHHMSWWPSGTKQTDEKRVKVQNKQGSTDCNCFLFLSDHQWGKADRWVSFHHHAQFKLCSSVSTEHLVLF